MLSASDVSIVVVFDNRPYRKDLKASWGFACVVRGAEKTILFDTGGDGAILMDNMKKLKIDPKTIDAVVLSHAHKDHTGGLSAFLAKNADVEVYLPRSFQKGFKDDVRLFGTRLLEVSDPQEIPLSALWLKYTSKFPSRVSRQNRWTVSPLTAKSVLIENNGLFEILVSEACQVAPLSVL